MYDLTQLKTFITVVQEGHLTRAAERLHISQPAASHHIRALEEHFGLPLFRRTPRGLEATAAGKRIAEWAGTVVQASHELDDRARELVGVPSGRLVIGTIANRRLLAALPRAVNAVRARFPMTEISIEAGNVWTIRRALKTGEFDGGTVAGTVRASELACYALGTLDYVLVGPAAWRDRLEHAQQAQLAALPWIVTGRGTPSQEVVERCFSDEGLDINVAAEVSNAVLVRTMVAGEAGIGFVQQEEAAAGVQAGKFFAVPRVASSLPLAFVHALSRSSDAVLSCFAQSLVAAWEKEPGPPAAAG